MDHSRPSHSRGHILEQETSNPELVTHADALARSNLELPLGGHDLGIGTRDVDTSEQACLVVSLDNVTLDNLAGTDTAVVGSLRGGETVSGLPWLSVSSSFS